MKIPQNTFCPDNLKIFQELSKWHLPRMAAILETKPDLLAIETIPVVKEAEAILNNLELLPPIKVWVTFQCKVRFGKLAKK